MTNDMRTNETRKLEGTSRLEWFAATISAAILLGMIGYMIVYGLTQPNSPPQITLVAGQIEQIGSGYRMEFTARNDGSETAAALQIRGVLRAGDAVVEESRAVIDYVPGTSERRGGLLFMRDPRQNTIELRGEGYSNP